MMLLLWAFCLIVYGFELNGGIAKQEIYKMNTIVDKVSGFAISDAVVAVPNKGYKTQSDGSGKFELPPNLSPPFVLSVKKKGYQPFSLTVRSYGNVPFHLQISKSAANKIAIEADTFHLGDNSYSESSANAGDFRVRSSGVFYQKPIFVKALDSGENVILTLGSLIGVDTQEAKRLHQTSVIDAYSSPVKVFFNGREVGHFKINGDNQKISIPKTFIRQNAKNIIKIVAGINQIQTEYTDYDDFEFTNLFLEYR